MRRSLGAALIILGAASFYAGGRWGGIGADRSPGDLLPILGPSPGRPLVALLIGSASLLLGILLLGRWAAEAHAAEEGRRWRAVHAVPFAHGFAILACLGALATGAALGWDPKTLAAWAGVGMLEAALGLVLMPFYLRLPGSRFVPVLSCGMILLGAAWAASIVALGFFGA